MMTELFAIFNTINLPYFRQGSLSDDSYPESFFTFWQIDAPELLQYDNAAHKHIELIQVCFYTSNPSIIYSQMDDFITKAKAAGFVTVGRDYDTPSGKDNYYGRRVNIKILK